MNTNILNESNAFLSRDLDIIKDDLTKIGTVLFSKPEQQDEGRWACLYSVKGLPDIEPDTYSIFGVDSIQALLCAFNAVEGLLEGSEICKSGALHWCGNNQPPYLK